jgi:hypothetical protein
MRATQGMQVVMQNNIISRALAKGGEPLTPPLIMRLVSAFPPLQGLTARFLAIGVRPEHVQSPEA